MRECEPEKLKKTVMASALQGSIYIKKRKKKGLNNRREAHLLNNSCVFSAFQILTAYM